MRKQIIRATLMSLLVSGTVGANAQEQSLQQFDQDDFDELMRTNPELLGEVINPDGSVDRSRLAEILRNDYDFEDENEADLLPGFNGLEDRGLLSERTPEEIENDVVLQKRLAEEREKAFEIYKKRHGIE